ncbi:MAG: hypothetical protein EA384_03120 [Spirochaetaceae bacterium]|nr:MAG: hypothetical protein EA384_03120 [Spirochaetaceae bacterium]
MVRSVRSTVARGRQCGKGAVFDAGRQRRQYLLKVKKCTRVGRIVLVALGVVFVTAPVVPIVIAISPAGSASPRDLAGPESRFVRLEGIEIHYEASSAELGKQAFILLHGFGASTYSWREVVEPLSEIAPVIAFDRPAFGLTERPMQ